MSLLADSLSCSTEFLGNSWILMVFLGFVGMMKMISLGELRQVHGNFCSIPLENLTTQGERDGLWGTLTAVLTRKYIYTYMVPGLRFSIKPVKRSGQWVQGVVATWCGTLCILLGAHPSIYQHGELFRRIPLEFRRCKPEMQPILFPHQYSPLETQIYCATVCLKCSRAS